GFGEKFLIHNPIFKLCMRADGSIRHTKYCTFNDPRQVWLWTPGNLLMNAQTSTCLQAKKTTKANFLSMTVTQCNSPDLGQKWRCDDSRQLWGTSLDSINITHAVRYYNNDKYLKARSVKYLVSPGNNWTVFPSNNRSVCSASHNEDSEPLVVENREDGLYFEWKTNPYTRLKGRILDMTIECVRTDTAKFEEYLFRLRVKDITFTRVQEQYQIIQTDSGEIFSIPIVDLDKDCSRNICFRKITVASTLNKTTAVCAIQWKESTLSSLDNTSVATKNITELLSLRKVEETFNLEWNLTQARLLAKITFNLTILCYNDKNENTTTVEKSSLVFQARCLLQQELEMDRHRRASPETDFRENQEQNRPPILEKSAVALNSLRSSTSDQSTQGEQCEVPSAHHYEYVDKRAFAPPKTLTYDYAFVDEQFKNDRKASFEPHQTGGDDYVITNDAGNTSCNSGDDYVIKNYAGNTLNISGDDYVIKNDAGNTLNISGDDYVIKNDAGNTPNISGDDYVIKNDAGNTPNISGDDYVIKNDAGNTSNISGDDYVIKNDAGNTSNISGDEYVIKIN
ncbi:Hypothetical predicted protein, partial [Paramuricea clavata]